MGQPALTRGYCTKPLTSLKHVEQVMSAYSHIFIMPAKNYALNVGRGRGGNGGGETLHIGLVWGTVKFGVMFIGLLL